MTSTDAQSSPTAFRLYLIRHAESENNARPVYQRVCDPAITRRGRLQADCLATWMRTLPLDVLVTSPFRRTLETTQAILAQRGRPVEVWHDIFEIGGCYNGFDETNFTGAAGMGCTDIERFFSREPASATASTATASSERVSSAPAVMREHGQGLLSDPERPLPCTVDSLLIDPEISDTGWWNCRPREQSDTVQVRATRVANRLMDTYGDSADHVALVIHADFKRELLRVLLRDILCLDHVTPITNAAVSILSWEPDRAWQLHSLNSVTHLPLRLQ